MADPIEQGVFMTANITQSQVGPDHKTTQARLKAEQESLAAWATADSEERELVQIIVYSALSRLMQDPSWIPASTRLGSSRLEINLVVELDGFQVQQALHNATMELSRSYSRSKEALRLLEERLVADDA